MTGIKLGVICLLDLKLSTASRCARKGHDFVTD